MESETEQQYLEEIAQYGQRKLLLWQLAADGRSFCGVSATVKALGLEDASVEEQVEAFVEDLRQDGEIRQEYDDGTDWKQLERLYGDTATELLEEVEN
ncbi:hypothetical protein [Haloarcula sp. 1CSR25-25]|jgi:glutaredoxin-related protein|uniref:hypothetical protein n=1 Tax=Haloarcula sp. 1CSR25-25 TaxID=2862545 RepID=UPI002894D7F9|nr:hypothetical protein [Haloarcula sp. 1CSR25-25]MDT3437846.1 hypothetical protein [Haloarcula sp. 1CSR25-25]